MLSYDKATALVIRHEGGLVDDKYDPGGITKWGISKRFLIIHNIDLNGDGVIDNQDIIDMTMEQCQGIYKTYFWDKYPFRKVKYEPLAIKLFDMSFPLGEPQAFKLFQRSINDMGGDIKVDGILGSKTIAGANKFNGEQLLHHFQERLKDFFQKLASNRPDSKRFLNGWLNRVVAEN